MTAGTQAPHHFPDTRVVRSLEPNRVMSILRHWMLLGWICVAILAWLKSYVCVVLVDGDSMVPTFHSGDLLLIHKRTYENQSPSRGDVVVSRFRSELIVKRIVGLPGETVEVVKGRVYINGSPIPETHAMSHGNLNVRSGELFPGRYAVLGDNRTSTDYQLFYAVVPQESVIGKATLALRLGWTGLHLWRT